MSRGSETRTEEIARELLSIRGWNTSRPPRGNLLWKHEYREYPELLDAFRGASKHGHGDGVPDFVVVDPDQGPRPLLVGETKAASRDAPLAAREACDYATRIAAKGRDVLAVGIAGTDESDFQAEVRKRGADRWRPVEYRGKPIQWIPTPDETTRLLADQTLFELQPRVPSADVLAERGDEITRILRECAINDAHRPAVMGAFMLGLWKSAGDIPNQSEHVLGAINRQCRKAFEEAGKLDIAESIEVPEANRKLANRAGTICNILRLLNITTLTGEHDYLGQLYEMFFRFIGSNTIGQFFTPRHIARFMTDMMEVGERDMVIDPTCGTGGFLVASLYRMMAGRSLTRSQVRSLVAKHLRGFESEPITAALCVANMILRGDGTTGIVVGDCFTDKSFPEDTCTVALGNPPFPHKKTDTPSEAFVNRALEALKARGKLAMVVPASVLVKSEKRQWRRSILAENTLRAVIALPNELFLPYAASTTAIIALERGVPHTSKTETFFARVENDGYRLKKSVRVEQPGDELPEILDAFLTHQSKPGAYTWSRVSPHEWAPGAHIEAGTPHETTLRAEIESLFRSNIAFHSLKADKLHTFRAHLTTTPNKPKSYQSMTTRPTRLISAGRGTIGHYFDVYYGQRELHSKEHLQPGPALVISSSGTDNGCYGFFEFDALIAPPFVTVPSTGSIGEAFVQEWPCGVTDDCLLLIPRDDTPPEMLYIAAAVVRLERWRFNYGRKITPDRVSGFKLPSGKALVEWVTKRWAQTTSLADQVLEGLDQAGIESRFGELVKAWRNRGSLNGSVRTMALDPSYQRIIGMGLSAVPLILAELRREPDHWFWALHSITGADPVTPNDRGNIERMAAAWIAWGQEHGYRA